MRSRAWRALATAVLVVGTATACAGASNRSVGGPAARDHARPAAAPAGWAPVPPSATQSAGGAVSVFPSPGTRVASPQSQVSIRGVAPGKIGPISVVGSSSGTHRGRLVAHSDGQGASFVPLKHFAPGERVTVHTRLRVRGASNGRFAFTVARPVPDALLNRPEPNDPEKVLAFRSRPDLHVPRIDVITRSAAASPGAVFVAPRRGAGQNGPEILDGRGNVVWFRPLPAGVQATDFREQVYRGKPVLTWFEGRLAKGHGYGVGVILDDSYRRIATVRAGDGYSNDLHEFQLTSRDTALVTAYRPVRWNLSAVGGPRNGVAFDGIVQEVDVKTGSVLFEWHSLGNVPLGDSYGKPKGNEAFDYFHVNGIDAGADGDLLVSGRGTHTVYELDGRTGAIHWRLGGKHSDFELGSGVRFHSQHDPRWLDANTLSIFDNGAGVGGNEEKSSRAIVVRLDRPHRTATLVHAFVQPRGKLFSSQGDVQKLPDGNFFVGWGEGPYATEFTPSGAVVFAMHFASGESYRAYRFPWSGHPTTKPSLAAVRKGASVTVYASWNGATEVARLQVLAGASADDLSPVASAPAAGFETTVTADTSAPYVAVRALDRSGATLATSAVVHVM